MKLDGVQIAMLRQLATRSRTISGGLNSAAMKQLVKLGFVSEVLLDFGYTHYELTESGRASVSAPKLAFVNTCSSTCFTNPQNRPTYMASARLRLVGT